MRAALPAASVAEFSAAEIGGECTESSGASSAPPHYLVLVEAARDQAALPADAAARLEAAPARYQTRVDMHICMHVHVCMHMHMHMCMDSIACLLVVIIVLILTFTTTQGGATRGQPRVCRLARQGRHRPV